MPVLRKKGADHGEHRARALNGALGGPQQGSGVEPLMGPRENLKTLPIFMQRSDQNNRRQLNICCTSSQSHGLLAAWYSFINWKMEKPLTARRWSRHTKC